MPTRSAMRSTRSSGTNFPKGVTFPLLSRSAWNARAPKWSTPIAASRGVFIHYNGPAVPAAVAAGDRDAVARFLRGIQDFHMDGNGWPDIAYSFCVDATGTAWTLRGWRVAGAHTMGWNEVSHAIFLPLGGDQGPTDAQVATARALVADHNRMFGVGFLKGHREAPNSTSCPGDAVMARIADFNPLNAPPEPEPEEDDDMAKQAMIRDPREPNTIWHVFGNTRYPLRDEAEVKLLEYLGVPLIANNDPSLVTWLRTCKDLGRK
jgi:hypothetical protein